MWRQVLQLVINVICDDFKSTHLLPVVWEFNMFLQFSLVCCGSMMWIIECCNCGMSQNRLLLEFVCFFFKLMIQMCFVETSVFLFATLRILFLNYNRFTGLSAILLRLDQWFLIYGLLSVCRSLSPPRRFPKMLLLLIVLKKVIKSINN